MAQLESKIVTCLQGFTGVSALVHGQLKSGNAATGYRIFPLLLVEKTLLPAITYQRISGGQEFTLKGYAGCERARIQVDCWATTYAQIKQLAAAVRAAMTAATTFTVSDMSDLDLFEDAQNIYRVSIDFTVRHQEA